jgi:DNA-binding response OmpR family regulator
MEHLWSGFGPVLAARLGRPVSNRFGVQHLSRGASAPNLHGNRPLPPHAPGTLGLVGAPLICVIEDEVVIAGAVAKRLEAEGFAVVIAHDGPEGVALCDRTRPDVVVLDLMLPGIDGLEVCRRIQRDRPVPVLMLTARDDEADVLVGLGVGADDYMTKPFSPRELVARIRALLRRVERRPEPVGELTELGALRVDPASRRVTVDGDEKHLTPTEFDLLRTMAARPGVVFTREQLLAEVWGWRDGSGHRTVDSHIRGLRRKLGSSLVRTVHGIGYALEP